MARGCSDRRLAAGWAATSSRRAAVRLLAAAPALVIAAPAAAGPCSQTTAAAFRACLAEANADRQTANGICFNLSDAAERADCLAEAQSQRQEDGSLCHEQRSARGELCQALGEAAYDPEFDPANFVDPDEIGGMVEPNRYFPLVQGYQWVYQSEDQKITVTVTDRTKVIEGVSCVVVTDQVEEEGALVEDTEDWHAQDLDGNVWYCGELAKTLETFEDDDPAEPELVDLEGSWKTGRDGAKPGIIMSAAPEVGDLYRQEFALGTAEDAAEVISTTGSAKTQAATCAGDCVVTRDFSPLEPEVEETKSYAPGVGLILEVEDGVRTELVETNIP